MLRLRLLTVTYFYFFTRIVQGNTEARPFTEEDFLTRGICILFGGECGDVCPHRYIRHKWSIPLCPLSMQECCIGAAPDGEAAPTLTTPISTTIVTTAAPEYGVCGVLPSGDTRKKRIVGGHTAARGSWPWLVALRNLVGSTTCSGAVIAQRWIVTAAHCFKYVANPSLWRVRVGEHDLLTNEDNERDLRIEQIIVHPQHSSQTLEGSDNGTIYNRYVNDIALVQLDEDALIEPVCLPSLQHGDEDAEISNVIRETPEVVSDGESDLSDNPRFRLAVRSLGLEVPGEVADSVNEISEPVSLLAAGRRSRQNGGNCWVAGWGLTLDESIQGQVLREVSGDIITREQCSQMWGVELPDNMICFGDGTFGPCAGDSGAPMSCERNGQFYLAGVVSWGSEDCNVSGRPSVFTRTWPFLDWIQENVSRGQRQTNQSA